MSRLLRYIPVTILVLFYSFPNSYSQPLKFITYTTNNGLLHNFTKKCVEDKKGFIWIVSETGISRFDGVNFKNFQHDENDPTSLPHNIINDIEVDTEGRIWLATKKGLCYYDPDNVGFRSIDIEGMYSNSPAVLALCFDPDKQAIWFITDKVLCKYSIQTKSVNATSCLNTSPTQINQIYLSSDHRLWIALYRDGFLLYDIASDKVTAQLPDGWVTSFFEGKDNTMWIGNWHSLHLVAWNMSTGAHENWTAQGETGTDAYMIISSITHSPFDDDSSLMISTQTMGIQQFNMKLKKYTGGYSRDLFIKYSLPSDFINYIYTDSRGIIWVCTWNGFCKMNMLEQQFRTLEIPFLNPPMFQYYNLIEGIVSSDKPGTWWLGVNGCGLFEYDPEKKSVIKELFADIHDIPESIPDGSWTEFLIRLDDGTIWSGNEEGLVKIEKDKITRYVLLVHGYYSWKKNICIAPDHTFWISAEAHLIHFEPGSGKYDVYEIDSSLHQPLPIKAVAESAFSGDHTLWTGTQKGLFKFDIRSNVAQRIALQIPEADSLEVNTINSLVADDHEKLYLGTLAGLIEYDVRTGQMVLKGKEEKVSPILSKSLLRDKAGNFWIYTPHALFRYNPGKDEFSKFTTSDGIHNFSSDPAHLFEFDNNFYIGYRGAFTVFDPLKVDVNQTLVKPLITEVLIGNELQKINLDRFSTYYLPVSAGKKEITFHFTGIDYTNSDRITFMYKLDTDADWHEAGTNRSVTYTNLQPGNYSFQLKARNSSGIINENLAVFNLVIAPTLMQRWWFWPFMAILFVTIVIVLANKRVRKIRTEETLKTKTKTMLAELETKLLRSQMNPHFIFNSLNSIQKYIWENKEEDAAEYLARFAKLIRAILENSRKEFISLREELEVLKLYIELEHRRSNGKFDYRIHVAENLHPDDLMIPPLLLQPYIENAIWHGVNKKAGHGNIEISIRQVEQSLEFIIDDDGVGRNFNQMHPDETKNSKISMGTDITQQRISHLQNNISSSGVRIMDKMNEGIPTGTTVIVSIPVNSKAHA
ncbi:MAG TPA: histidine kinase [Saprospiraceae bacterium]|nr:histidine kinase [Saprospiraceae bacterium]